MLLPSEERESRHRLKLSELLKPKLTDLIIILTSLIPTFFFFINAFYKRNFPVFSTCNSGILNLIMAKTLYSSDKSFFNYLSKNKLARYNSFPLYPFLFRLFYYLCLKSWKIATIFIITLLSLLCNFFFNRFLICTRFIKNPLLSTLIFSIFPIRSLYLRNITNEYSLFILLFTLIYIGQQTRSFKLLAISSFFIILASDCGFFAVLGFLISSIILKNKKEFRYIFFSLLSGLAIISIFHKSISGRFFPIFGDFLFDKRYPFKELLAESQSISRLRQLHGLYNYYIIPLFASLLSIPIDKTIGIPLLLSLLYSSSKFGYIGIDSACPIEAISVIIGFDILIKHPRFKSALYFLAPFYITSVFYLTLIHFNSQRDLNSTQYNVYNM